MKKPHKISTIFTYLPLLALCAFASISAVSLRALPSTADSIATSLTVGSGCSLTIDGSSEHTATLTPGLLTELDGVTLISTCNGAYDSSIYAVGYTNNVTGSTSLIDSSNPDTSTNSFLSSDSCTSSSTSSCWSMKISPLSTDAHPFTPQNGYDNYKSIPSVQTQIASTTLKTDASPKSTLNTKYAIYSTSAQPAGTYTGKVKYTLNSSASVLKYYIQDFTLDMCKVNVGQNGNTANVGDQITVYDRRDENDYTVRYINGYCWMTQNLRITGGTIISSNTSNAPYGYSYIIPSTDLTNGSSYTEARLHASGDISTGYWYNFCLASAGTICSDSNSYAAADYSICPAGWKLPTHEEWSSVVSFSLVFNPVAGGSYGGGILAYTDHGYWWSATARYGLGRYISYYDGANLSVTSEGRDRGQYVRCLRFL